MIETTRQFPSSPSSELNLHSMEVRMAVRYFNFLQVGQLLWTLILAFLGGLLARYSYSTRADEK